jgi:serine/threonine-protein kinase
MTLVPGTFVTPNICLVRQLGEGGMGSVWIADHRSLHTRVAVKFIAAELVRAEPAVVERFAREAELAAQIKSPHVVQTFDHGVMHDGRPYIVMELLEGESLRARLERNGTLSVEEQRTVVNQTCKALGKAHRLGILHRDIKPDNLFLTPDEDELFLLKVLDFGIAKQTGLPQVSKMTSTGSMVGTPQYMSPEQVLSGSSLDFRTDLWAVAVVAYHGLTGDVPFQGETLGSLCVAIANGRFVPPSARRPGVPASVDRWFERALSVDRERRFASAKELAQSFSLAISPNATLENFTTSEGVPALDATLADPRLSSPANLVPSKLSAPRPPGVAPMASSASGPHTHSPSIVPAQPSLDSGDSARRPWLAFALAGLAVLGGLGFFFWSGKTSSSGATPVESPGIDSSEQAHASPPLASAATTPTALPTESSAVASVPFAAPSASGSVPPSHRAAPTPSAAAIAGSAASAQGGSVSPRPPVAAPPSGATAKDRGF